LLSSPQGFLDIIEKDLFEAHMPSVSYMRLDGGVEASKRFDVVKKFNADPTIDVLLLTTHGEPRQGLLN
jgi:TATA-binding protein-associated factor